MNNEAVIPVAERASRLRDALCAGMNYLDALTLMVEASFGNCSGAHGSFIQIISAIEQRMMDASSELDMMAGMASAAAPAAADALPAFDYGEWSIVDYELAWEAFIRASEAMAAVCNQPRAISGHQYRPGAAYFHGFMEKPWSRRLDQMMSHLQGVRFGDADSELRRTILIIRYFANMGVDDANQIIEPLRNAGVLA